eukprot:5196693-Amphidinium_carterae.1
MAWNMILVIAVVCLSFMCEGGDPSIQVVVVTKRHCRGYNEAARLGVLVTGQVAITMRIFPLLAMQKPHVPLCQNQFLIGVFRSGLFFVSFPSRGVYPGNAADRHQLIGRLKRIGQRRNKIEH